MNLQQFLEEIENIKLFLERFGFKKVILHNIENAEEDEASRYYPIKLRIVPVIHSTQASAISFVLSQLYKTKFEIQSISEGDDDILPFLDPKNGVDILGNGKDKIKEAVLKIFGTSEEELQDIEFSAPTPINLLHVPKEWKELLIREQQAKGIAREIIPLPNPVIFTHKRALAIPATPPQLHLSEEASPPRKAAKRLDSFARTSEHPEEFWEKVADLVALADTPEHQQACLQAINAFKMQARLPKPITFNQ